MITDIKPTEYNNKKSLYIKCYIDNKYLLRLYVGRFNWGDLSFIKFHRGLYFSNEIIYKINFVKSVIFHAI